VNALSALGAISISMPVSSRLQRFLRIPVGHLALFALYNVPTTLAGAGLFYSEVHYLGGNKFAMHALNFPIITAMTFLVNARVPGWRERCSNKWRGMSCWGVYSLAKWGISQGLYILLAGVAGLPWFWISQALVLGLGIVSYLVNEHRVFPHSDKTDQKA
jgi:hypothetical protein